MTPPTIPFSKVLADVGNPDVVEVGEVVIYDHAGAAPVGFGASEAEARLDAQHVAGTLGVAPESLAGPAFLIVEG